MTTSPLRIGTLGAAKIAPPAIVKPAAALADAELVAVAARDRSRAEKFARRHGVPRVHASYEALIADPDIDAVYNPLPNSLHKEWTLRALDAGKHVLCEKPLTSNAEEAEELAAAAQRTGLVLMEAFHWRYHPLAERMKAIVDSGELGTVRHLEAWMCIPLPFFRDIRYQWSLAGGATMDLGCYCIDELRFLAGDEPEVTSAKARVRDPQIDRWMEADFRWADGRTGRMTCALWSSTPLRINLRVQGDNGELKVLNPSRPHSFHRISVRTREGRRRERAEGDPTYTGQLRSFVAAVRDGAPVPSGPDNAIANMRVIDAVYRAAGLKPRAT